MNARCDKDWDRFMLIIKYISDKHGNSDDFARTILKTRALKPAMMQELLTGRTRLA